MTGNEFEDRILIAANILMVVSTIPAILEPSSAIPRWQSVVMITGLLLVVYANWRLGVRKSAGVAFIAVLLWVFILFFRPL